MVRAGEALEFGGQRGAGEGAAGEDDEGVGVVLVEGGDLFAVDGDAGFGSYAGGYSFGELDAVYGEGVAGGDGGGVGVGEEDGTGAAHLLFEEPGGGVFGLGLEGVGADEFGEVGGLVGLGGTRGTHLVEIDFAAEFCCLKGGFGACEASADDFDSLCRQGTAFSCFFAQSTLFKRLRFVL